MPLMAEAELHVVANPLINITLQGRHDSYPKRRGMTRVPELMAAGVNVAFGHDCVMDPWYSLGSDDMLEVAAMGLHVAQMTGQAEMPRVLRRRHRQRRPRPGAGGLRPRAGLPRRHGDPAGADPVEALRLKPARLFVIRRGKLIAETAAVRAGCGSATTIWKSTSSAIRDTETEWVRRSPLGSAPGRQTP